MAEASHGDLADAGQEENAEATKKMQSAIKPPNKKKYEEDLDSMNAVIKTKENELKSLNIQPDEKLQGELRAIRAEKDATIGRRKQIDGDLTAINQNISKQMAELSRVESGLRYRNEDRINDAIRRLEYQLKMQNFKLKEEKKIVAEVDSLKRSKKVVGTYLQLKKEIDGMRDRQRRIREERDHYYRTVTQLKQKEEERKRMAQSGRVKAEEIKKDLDELHEKRRQLTNEFKNQEREFLNAKAEEKRRHREDLQRRKDKERRQHYETYQKELAEFEASREPFEDEKNLCVTLTSYLMKYVADSETQHSAQDAHHNECHDAQRDLEAKGLFVLKKKMDDELFGGVVRPKTKRNRRDKRKSITNKPFVHTPQIFAQFASLDLTAPASVADVPKALQLLEEKRKQFDDIFPALTKTNATNKGHQLLSMPSGGGDIIPPVLLLHNSSPPVSDADLSSMIAEVGSIGTPSIAESALCESISSMPSTPEVLLDNQPPRYHPDRSAVSPMSLDSGACELENISDDQGTELASSEQSTPVADEPEEDFLRNESEVLSPESERKSSELIYGSRGVLGHSSEGVPLLIDQMPLVIASGPPQVYSCMPEPTVPQTSSSDTNSITGASIQQIAVTYPMQKSTEPESQDTKCIAPTMFQEEIDSNPPKEQIKDMPPTQSFVGGNTSPVVALQTEFKELHIGQERSIDCLPNHEEQGVDLDAKIATDSLPYETISVLNHTGNSAVAMDTNVNKHVAVGVLNSKDHMCNDSCIKLGSQIDSQASDSVLFLNSGQSQAAFQTQSNQSQDLLQIQKETDQSQFLGQSQALFHSDANQPPFQAETSQSRALFTNVTDQSQAVLQMEQKDSLADNTSGVSACFELATSGSSDLGDTIVVENAASS